MNPILMAATMDYSKPIESLADKFSFGGMMLLIGVCAVFAVLFVIYISLVLFKFAFSNQNKKKKKADNIETVQVAPVETANDDAVIVAVIAAAIAAAEAENPGKQFKVVSFRRT